MGIFNIRSIKDKYMSNEQPGPAQNLPEVPDDTEAIEDAIKKSVGRLAGAQDTAGSQDSPAEKKPTAPKAENTAEDVQSLAQNGGGRINIVSDTPQAPADASPSAPQPESTTAQVEPPLLSPRPALRAPLPASSFPKPKGPQATPDPAPVPAPEPEAPALNAPRDEAAAEAKPAPAASAFTGAEVSSAATSQQVTPAVQSQAVPSATEDEQLVPVTYGMNVVSPAQVSQPVSEPEEIHAPHEAAQNGQEYAPVSEPDPQDEQYAAYYSEEVYYEEYVQYDEYGDYDNASYGYELPEEVEEPSGLAAFFPEQPDEDAEFITSEAYSAPRSEAEQPVEGNAQEPLVPVTYGFDIPASQHQNAPNTQGQQNPTAATPETTAESASAVHDAASAQAPEAQDASPLPSDQTRDEHARRDTRTVPDPGQHTAHTVQTVAGMPVNQPIPVRRSTESADAEVSSAAAPQQIIPAVQSQAPSATEDEQLVPVTYGMDIIPTKETAPETDKSAEQDTEPAKADTEASKPHKATNEADPGTQKPSAEKSTDAKAKQDLVTEQPSKTPQPTGPASLAEAAPQLPAADSAPVREEKQTAASPQPATPNTATVRSQDRAIPVIQPTRVQAEQTYPVLQAQPSAPATAQPQDSRSQDSQPQHHIVQPTRVQPSPEQTPIMLPPLEQQPEGALESQRVSAKTQPGEKAQQPKEDTQQPGVLSPPAQQVTAAKPDSVQQNVQSAISKEAQTSASVPGTEPTKGQDTEQKSQPAKAAVPDNKGNKTAQDNEAQPDSASAQQDSSNEAAKTKQLTAPTEQQAESAEDDTLIQDENAPQQSKHRAPRDSDSATGAEQPLKGTAVGFMPQGSAQAEPAKPVAPAQKAHEASATPDSSTEAAPHDAAREDSEQESSTRQQADSHKDAQKPQATVPQDSDSTVQDPATGQAETKKPKAKEQQAQPVAQKKQVQEPVAGEGQKAEAKPSAPPRSKDASPTATADSVGDPQETEREEKVKQGQAQAPALDAQESKKPVVAPAAPVTAAAVQDQAAVPGDEPQPEDTPELEVPRQEKARQDDNQPIAAVETTAQGSGAAESSDSQPPAAELSQQEGAQEPPEEPTEQADEILVGIMTTPLGPSKPSVHPGELPEPASDKQAPDSSASAGEAAAGEASATTEKDTMPANSSFSLSPKDVSEAMNRKATPQAQTGGPLEALFVCTGNVARSAAAELIAHGMAAEQGLADTWVFKSAGTAALTGSGPYQYISQELAERGYDTADFKARQLTAQEVERATLILVAEKDHADWILREWPQHHAKVHLLKQVARIRENASRRAEPLSFIYGYTEAAQDADNIADPYRKGQAACRAAVDEIETALEVIMPWLVRARA